MQLPTRMQGNGALAAVQVTVAVWCQHILVYMSGRQVMMFAQGASRSDQFDVVLQAGQPLAGLQ